MTRVLALADHSKIGCITQRRFAKVGTKTHPQRGAALDRNGLSVSTETACRFEPKSPVGNSEICSGNRIRTLGPGVSGEPFSEQRPTIIIAVSIDRIVLKTPRGSGATISSPAQPRRGPLSVFPLLPAPRCGLTSPPPLAAFPTPPSLSVNGLRPFGLPRSSISSR
jgi:hypothetical protein